MKSGTRLGVVICVVFLQVTTILTELPRDYSAANTEETETESPPWHDFQWVTEIPDELEFTTKISEVFRKYLDLEREIDRILVGTRQNVSNLGMEIVQGISKQFDMLKGRIGSEKCREDAQLRLTAVKAAILQSIYDCPYKNMKPLEKMLHHLKRHHDALKMDVRSTTSHPFFICKYIRDPVDDCNQISSTLDESKRLHFIEQQVRRFAYYAKQLFDIETKRFLQICYDEQAITTSFYSAIRDCENHSYLLHYT